MSQETRAQGPSGIPFAFFVSLVRAISQIKPRQAKHKKNTDSPVKTSLAYKTFCNWIAELHRCYAPLPSETTSVVFRLLFPEEDVKRKYGMQETLLAQQLAKLLMVSTLGRGSKLIAWNGEESVGCLGQEVEHVMSATSTLGEGSLNISDVDASLTELASMCAFSAAEVRSTAGMSASARTPGGRSKILRKLYTHLSPTEAGVVTQIILKDLRPLLYPLPEDAAHYRTALVAYNSKSVTHLTKEDAMRAWDPSKRMLAMYRIKASLDDVTRAHEMLRCQGGIDDKHFRPQVGVPIEIPKCIKGQSGKHALEILRGADTVWAETKYDGERAQIHVELTAENPCDVPKITIFSKSGRDSTLDRFGIHSVICDALGLGRSQAPPVVKKSVILEAEMVAFSDTLGRVDEFWRIRSLIAQTAVGVRHKVTRAPEAHHDERLDGDSQSSLISNGSDGGTRRLALVFFDILLLDDDALISAPYAQRRNVLELVIAPDPGRVMLAERVPISMSPSPEHVVEASPEAQLRSLFAKLIADHEEGVVLKADQGRYNDRDSPWVKLKKDYIPGHGDAVDLVVIGAAWEKDRARELRVPPTAFTTFYIGSLANGQEITKDSKAIPHFEVIFTASYGLTREKLEELNFIIKSSGTVEPNQTRGLPYTYTISPSLNRPTVLLQHPVLAELYGAQFTKAQGSKYYELRNPRITKVFRKKERTWREGMGLQEYQNIARKSVGRDRPNKDIDDWCNSLWGKPSSPGAKCARKRGAEEQLWVDRLCVADGESPTKKRRVAREGKGGAVGGILDLRGEPRRERALESIMNIAQTAASRASPTPGPRKSPVVLLDTSRPANNAPLEAAMSASAGATRCDMAADDHVAKPSAYPSIDSPLNEERRSSTPAPPAVNSIKGDTESTPTTTSPTQPSPSSRISLSPLPAILADAVVSLARPCGSPTPSWRMPSHRVVPSAQQVHTLDAFFLACGWGLSPEQRACSWVARGVLFVDDRTPGDGWMEHPLKALLERRGALLRAGPGVMGKCKPVSLFSMRLLAGGVDAEGAERAICTFA